MKQMDFFAPANEKEKQEIIKDLTKNTAAFGIDLGTTNSAISVIPSGTHPVTIPLAKGRTTLPSCVMWTGEGKNFIVGMDAYNQRYEENCIYSVKRLMQDVTATVTLRKDGKELVMTPAEVSAEILKGLVREAGDTYGEIKDVVVTVPAYFDVNGKKATKEAVQLAGLNLLGLIAEPTAASLCYELDAGDDGVKDIVVYDLGGGTFDVSLVRIMENKDTALQKQLAEIYGFDDYKDDAENPAKVVSVICSDGDTHLGGDDIDGYMLDILVNKLRADGYTDPISHETLEKLKLQLEKLKKGNVDSMYFVDCHLDNDVHCKVKILPTDFKEALRPVYEKTREIIERVLLEHRNSVKTIVLVGGSTKNPHLVSMLKEDYPSFYVNNAFPPDESVSLGAGIHAKELKFGDNAVSVFDSLSIGIGIVEGKKLKTVIPKNSRYPVTKCKVFTNVVDNQQSIAIEIMQGDSQFVEEAVSLGTLVIDDLPLVPAETLEIIINLMINANGILTCNTEIRNPLERGKSIKRDLELNLAKAETGGRKLTREEKLIRKWEAKADQLPEHEAGVLRDMIKKFPEIYSKNDVMDFIRSCMELKKV